MTEEDVEAKIIKNLNSWLKDSLIICSEAHLTKFETTSVIMRALLWVLLSGLMEKGARLDDVLKVISANWNILHQDKAERKLN